MAKAQSKTSKKTKSKPAAKSTKKKVAKAAVKKPIAKAAAKSASKASKPIAKATKASKPLPKKAAKVAKKVGKAIKKAATTAASKKALKKPAVSVSAKKPTKAAAAATTKSPARKAKTSSAAVASAAETTQAMEALLAQATPGDGQVAAPQHRDAAASLVTEEHELDSEVEGAGHQDDDENFDGRDDMDDMDDASFNDRGTADSETAGRPTYVDDGSPFPVQLARLLHDDKCTDIVLLDLRGVNPMWDYVIIGSGTSDRQMRSVLTHVAELGRLLGHEVFRRNVDDRATWLLADFSDVIVHLFEPNTRAHYDLEMLWGDAKRVEWERPAQLPRNRAGLVAGDGL